MDESIRCTVNGTEVKYPGVLVLSSSRDAVKHARLIIGSDPTAMQVARDRSAWETARNRPALAVPVERYPLLEQKRTRLLNTEPR